MLSHVAIFLVAYIGIEDAGTGWLAIDGTTCECVLVVWMMNQENAGGVDPAAQFVSRISQPGRLAIYFASCLGISTLVYVVLGSFVAMRRAVTASRRASTWASTSPLRYRCPDLETTTGNHAVYLTILSF